MGPKPVPFSILENSVAKRDLNSTVWSPLASFDLRNGWPTFNVYCEFASLLGSLALCGKLPCDNHAAQVEVKAALKYEGEKKTLYGGRGKALPSIAHATVPRVRDNGHVQRLVPDSPFRGWLRTLQVAVLSLERCSQSQPAYFMSWCPFGVVTSDECSLRTIVRCPSSQWTFDFFT